MFASPVVRVSVTPPTGTSVVADTTVVPAVAEVIVTVQLAVAADRVRAGGRADEACPGRSRSTPSACAAGAIRAVDRVDVTVSTWFVPTGLFAVAGVIWMFASTNVFTASPELAPRRSSCTVTDGRRSSASRTRDR